MTTETERRLAASAEAAGQASRFASEYLLGLAGRDVAAAPEALANLAAFDEALPDAGSDPSGTIAFLHSLGSPATTATAGGRFFGLVMGGTLPAALGARVLASAWDQAVFNDAISPVGVKLEQVASGWLLDLLGLPAQSSVGFVTGATIGNFTCLAAARHALLKAQGWDVERDGLQGARRLRVYASEQIHVTVLKALAMLGLGSECVERLACDANGAVSLAELPRFEGPCLVLLQAGNVNSGAWDPVGDIVERARPAKAWVHVDGAFGLWAAACAETAAMTQGYDRADSWVTDGHKWLNTPYDCGLAICRYPEAVHAAMATQAPYLKSGGTAAPKDMVPEFSRSARGVEVWAALRSLGREGVSGLVGKCCAQARDVASGLERLGFKVLNDVVLNQVVAAYPGLEDRSAEIAQAVQASGRAWFGPTVWQGTPAIRISVSSWATTAEDIGQLLAAIDTALSALKGRPPSV